MMDTYASDDPRYSDYDLMVTPVEGVEPVILGEGDAAVYAWPVRRRAWTYRDIVLAVQDSEDFRRGLLAAAAVCRAQGTDPSQPLCPSLVAASYLERLASGEMP